MMLVYSSGTEESAVDLLVFNDLCLPAHNAETSKNLDDFLGGSDGFGNSNVKVGPSIKHMVPIE